jgi:hypothetical protein
VGEVRGRFGPSRRAVRAPVVVRHRDHETQGWDVPCAVAIDSAGRIYVPFSSVGYSRCDGAFTSPIILIRRLTRRGNLQGYEGTCLLPNHTDKPTRLVRLRALGSVSFLVTGN